MGDGSQCPWYVFRAMIFQETESAEWFLRVLTVEMCRPTRVSQSRAQLPGLDAKTSSLLAIPVATRAGGLTAPTSLLVLLQPLPRLPFGRHDSLKLYVPADRGDCPWWIITLESDMKKRNTASSSREGFHHPAPRSVFLGLSSPITSLIAVGCPVLSCQDLAWISRRSMEGGARDQGGKDPSANPFLSIKSPSQHQPSIPLTVSLFSVTLVQQPTSVPPSSLARLFFSSALF